MRTIKVLVSQAVPGMIVASDIYTEDSHLVIAKDTTLTDKIITRLVFYSIVDISVYSSASAEEEFISQNATSYYESIKKSEAFQRFLFAYKNNIISFKRTIDRFVSGEDEIETEELLNEAKGILDKFDSNIDLFNMLHCIRQYDDTTYIHSLNVALICNIIGKWLNFSREDLDVITLCGLLHDVGKLMIPSKIIKKPAKLTEDEYSIVKTHTVRGYNLLKNKDIDPRIKHAALMHHERCDGSGYPYGFHDEQIDSFAKLVSIADVYDAMTCARVYRGPLCPFQVVSIFESEGYTKYDPKYIMTFLEGIVQTYIHNTVKLNNGMEGEIIFINKMELSRPVVRTGEHYIDLTKQRDIQIASVI
jgi:uncharacterized domain HDIG